MNYVLEKTSSKRHTPLYFNKFIFTQPEKRYLIEQLYHMQPLVLRFLAESPDTEGDVLLLIYELCEGNEHFPIGQLFEHPNAPQELLKLGIETQDRSHILSVAKNPNTSPEILMQFAVQALQEGDDHIDMLQTLVRREHIPDDLFTLLLVNLQKNKSQPYGVLLDPLIWGIKNETQPHILWTYGDMTTRFEYLNHHGLQADKLIRLEAVLGGIGSSLQEQFENSQKLREALLEYANINIDYEIPIKDFPNEWIIELLKPIAIEKIKSFQ